MNGDKAAIDGIISFMKGPLSPDTGEEHGIRSPSGAGLLFAPSLADNTCQATYPMTPVY